MEKPPHHHGKLREALINAGLALMEEGGPDALTLRKCAARAGVSHAAPAHHFNGLISLKVAIIARGHKMFAKAMNRSASRAAPDPRAQLLAICEGYIQFAQAHSAVFKFMFQPHDTDMSALSPLVVEEVTRDSTASYLILQAACAPFEHWNNQADGTEVMIWSLVHGYAMLFCSEKDRSMPFETLPDFASILPELRLKP